MTFQLRKKDLKEMNIIKFGYCDIQNIERYLKKIGYTCGLYGRNEDIYTVEGSNYYISTGYRPTGNRPTNYKNRKKLDQNIEKRKRKILNNGDRHKKHDFINKKVYNLVQEHIKILYKE